ncbi:MAG: hypothetical protein KC731_33250 [Myxococcales bacterium]|nr:hypothetical protein [Myxococcales bacterium]
MYHYVSTPRTYCLEVLHYEDWAGEPPKLAAPYTFRLLIYPVPNYWGNGGIVAEDAGGNDSVGSAQLVPTEVGKANMILGRFEDATDVDVYALEAVNPSADYRAFGLSLPGPGGADSFGWGSDVGATITVLGPDATTVLARRSFDDMAATCSVYNLDNCLVLSPEVLGELTYVVVERQGDVSSFSNAAYSFLSTTVQFGGMKEGVDDGTNDVVAGAIELIPGVLPDGTSYSSTIGQLDTDDDVDWWRLDEQPDTEAHVWCGSAFHGSGIEDLTVEAFVSNSPGTPVRTQSETPTDPIRWGVGIWKGTAAIPPLPPLPAGSTYELKISGPTRDPDVTLDLYRCRVAQRPVAQ